jgi:hypothetical protein
MKCNQFWTVAGKALAIVTLARNLTMAFDLVSGTPS